MALNKKLSAGGLAVVLSLTTLGIGCAKTPTAEPAAAPAAEEAAPAAEEAAPAAEEAAAETGEEQAKGGEKKCGANGCGEGKCG
ncbi:MAG: hypothetical protein QGI45_15325 [Myxococcota bacterium]|nr:hypothetical protein [Myxococcota bacterium]